MQSLFERDRVIIVGGSGGVGKTSVSAALGILSARLGYKTLVLTIDPARRLAGALGLDELGGEPVDITPRLQEKQQIDGELHAMMLNVQNTFDQLVQHYSPEAALSARILDNRMYQTIVTRLSGSQEYASMQRLYQIAAEQHYDRIILDTPPTTHALDFLNAPRKLTDFFDSKVVQLFAGFGQKMGLSLWRPGTSIFLKALDRLSGAGVVGEIAQFFQLVEPLFEPVKAQPEKAMSLLQHPQTCFLIVSGPQVDQLKDALGFQQKLKDLNIRVEGCVVNRVMPLLLPPDTSLDNELEAEEGLPQRLLHWGQRLEQLARDQRQVIDRFAESLEGAESNDGLFKSIPIFEQDIHSLESLNLLVQALATD